MKKLTIPLVVYLFCFINQANAQIFTNYTYESTNTKLYSNSIFAIAIDAEGNKWFGTPRGVSKFDDTTWTTYDTLDGLVGNAVYAIAIDGEDNKWFGTHGGVSKFDGTTWTNYTTSDGLAGDYVRAIAIDAEGNKWFGTGEGVSKFDGTNWTTYTTGNGLADNHISEIAVDKEGNIWFGYGYEGDGITIFNGNNWKTYTTADGLANNYVYAIAIDAEGNKWFGTSGCDGTELYYYCPIGRGVSKFDDITWTTYTKEDGLASNNITAIAIDAEGNKWFGTGGKHHYDRYGGGVSKFDGTNWTTYTADGLVGNNVFAIAIDAKGNKWFGTDGRISKFDDTNWTTCDTLSLPNCGGRDGGISIDEEGNIWVVRREFCQALGIWGEGILKFNGTSWTIYSTADGLASNYVYAIAIDTEGNKWFGTPDGVSKFDDTTWTTYDTLGLIDEDSEGNVWFGANNGVLKFDGINWTPYDIPDSISSISSVDLDAEGNVWFGTDGGGVLKFDGTNWTNYTNEDGLASNDVISIAIDKEGNKWFGTGNGVSKFDDFNWTTYTTSDGLVNNYVQAIAVDTENNIWIGTGGGVSKLSAEVTGQFINVPAGQPTIQAGIDAATEGDTVLVAEGTYFENINFKGKAITVASRFILDGDTSHISKTIIDGSKPTNPDTASTVTMWSGEDTTSVLMGFTITGGTGTIHAFIDGKVRGGGGLYISGSGGKIAYNIIEENQVKNTGSQYGHEGGGIFTVVHNNHSLIIRENIIRGNTAKGIYAMGGGIAARGGRIICEYNEITDNLADGIQYSFGGGMAGIFFDVLNGVTYFEGVIHEAIVRNNIISGDTSISEWQCYGGGGYAHAQGYGEEFIQVYNNIICNNHTNAGGGGLFLSDNSQGRFFNNTILNNTAEYDANCAMVLNSKECALYNNIMWRYGSSTKNEFILSNPDAAKLLLFNNILLQPFTNQDPVTAFQNLYYEPVFQTGTYQLAEGSPGIGRAVDSLLVEGTWYYAPTMDFEGQARPDPADNYMDFGALESPFVRPVLDNADLIYIGYSNLELIPAFNRDTLHYEVHLPSYVTVPPTLNAIPADYLAEVDIDHATDMLENSTARITVTAENGTTQKEYTVFFRYKSNDARLCSLLVSLGELSPEFNSEIHEYEVMVNDTCPDAETPEVTYTTCSPMAKGTLTNAKNICNTLYNKTSIRVTAEDGTQILYKLTFIPLNVGIVNTNSYDLKVYPNPAEDILRIENSLPMTEVTVSNILGQKVLEYKLSSGTTCELSLAGLKKGMYFIRAKDESGQVYTGKVIKD